MKEFSCLENCPNLGECCRNFLLIKQIIILDGGMFRESIFYGQHKQTIAAAKATELISHMEWPFKAVSYDMVTECWRYSCTKLGENGLCTCYEARPDICRQFVAGSNKSLCCHTKTLAELFTELLTFIFKIITFSR